MPIGDSVGEGAVLVASGPVVYIDKNIALTIVVVKPSMRLKGSSNYHVQ